MKKKFIISLFVFIFIICASTFSDIHDYWEDGWVASSGLNSMDGTATNVHEIPGGYAFSCPGSGICYTINGPWLDIYTGGGTGGLIVDVYRR